MVALPTLEIVCGLAVGRNRGEMVTE